MAPPRFRALWSRTRRIVRIVWKTLVRTAGLVLLLSLLGDGLSSDHTLRGQATAHVRPYLFDYAGWEIDALWAKAKQEFLGIHSYLDDQTRHDRVLSFVRRYGDLRQIEATIEAIYADPTVHDPDAATADLRAERDALRHQIAADQPLVEGIIEEQVSAVLLDQGFGVAGQILPPVSMHFSELPMALVISPRDRIEYAVDLMLVALPVETRAALEARLDADLNVSSLIVPIGGISLYPSMIMEPPYPSDYLAENVARAFEVTAHEWAHHYLMFFPLGLEYTARPDTRIINETVATFFGRAVAVEVMRRYYPELEPPAYESFLHPLAADPLPDPALRDPDAPLPFDYGREMAITRATVDFLLWQGQIEAAETYMEYRRRLFVRHGYSIRKLNQAYLAFHGGYQGAPGAGGVDPIGPAVEELLARHPHLEDFLVTVRSITTRDELLAVLDAARE